MLVFGEHPPRARGKNAQLRTRFHLCISLLYEVMITLKIMQPILFSVKESERVKICSVGLCNEARNSFLAIA